MSHYYTDNSNLESKPQVFEATILNTVMKFKTDVGVFSKSGIDFGSRLLIENYHLPTIEGDLLEVGCGYGPIALTLAKVYQRNVEMIDVNDRALSLSKENAVNNDIDNVKIYKSHAFEHVSNQFASIITNPPIRAGKEVVYSIFDGAYEHLLPGGELWIVIQKKQGAPSAIKKLEIKFSKVDIVTKDKGYYIICAKKD